MLSTSHEKLGLDSKRTMPTSSPQIQGAARVTHSRVWTIVSCWDKTEDTRDMSHATFLAPYLTTGEALLEAARQTFPAKWAQLEAAGGVKIVERD